MTVYRTYGYHNNLQPANECDICRVEIDRERTPGDENLCRYCDHMQRLDWGIV